MEIETTIRTTKNPFASQIRRKCVAQSVDGLPLCLYDRSMMKSNLELIVAEGEGQTVEFKERVSRMDREMVAFANASGGSVFVGISDDGDVLGVEITNELTSRIQDMARNCDPPVEITLHKAQGPGPAQLVLPARTTSLVKIRAEDPSKPLELSYLATNFLIGVEESLPVVLRAAD